MVCPQDMCKMKGTHFVLIIEIFHRTIYLGLRIWEDDKWCNDCTTLQELFHLGSFIMPTMKWFTLFVIQNKIAGVSSCLDFFPQFSSCILLFGYRQEITVPERGAWRFMRGDILVWCIRAQEMYSQKLYSMIHSYKHKITSPFFFTWCFLIRIAL